MSEANVELHVFCDGSMCGAILNGNGLISFCHGESESVSITLWIHSKVGIMSFCARFSNGENGQRKSLHINFKHLFLDRFKKSYLLLKNKFTKSQTICCTQSRRNNTKHRYIKQVLNICDRTCIVLKVQHFLGEKK